VVFSNNSFQTPVRLCLPPSFKRGLLALPMGELSAQLTERADRLPTSNLRGIFEDAPPGLYTKLNK
ncbi:MAG: hypothetical protein IIY11_03985, partial [Clostridia bacterium]|nr:hypothetical protein [Clostridia bacterium]